MTDVRAAGQIAAHATKAMRSLETAFEVDLPRIFGRGKAVNEMRSHIALADAELGTALTHLGTEPELQSVRDALEGARNTLIRTRKESPREARAMASSMTYAVKRAARLSEAMVAVDATDRATAFARAKPLLARDAASWSQEEAKLISKLSYDVPEEMQLTVPRDIVGSKWSTRGEVLLEIARNRELQDHEQAMLRRLGNAMRIINFDARPVDVHRERARVLLSQGLREGWSDPALRSELQTLLTDVWPGFLAPGPTKYLTGAKEFVYLPILLDDGSQPEVLDRFARAWSLVLTPGITKETVLEQFMEVVRREPATWTNDDLHALRAMLDQDNTLHPLTNLRPKTSGVGTLLVLEGNDDYKFFAYAVARASEQGIEQWAPILHRHVSALREVADGAEYHTTIPQVQALMQKPLAELSRSEAFDLRKLALDMPQYIRPDGPSALPEAASFNDLLERHMSGAALPSDARDAERYWKSWNRALDPELDAAKVDAEFNAIALKDPSEWSAHEADLIASLMSWSASRHREDYGSWYPNPNLTRAFLERSEHATITDELRTFSNAYRANRDKEFAAGLAQRLDAGEPVLSIIGDITSDNWHVRTLADTLTKIDHEWSLTGAARLSELLDKPRISNSTRARVVTIIADTIKREAPGDKELVREVTKLVERNEKRLARKRPGMFQSKGYSDYPDFRELGTLRARLELVAMLKGIDPMAQPGVSW